MQFAVENGKFKIASLLKQLIRQELNKIEHEQLTRNNKLFSQPLSSPPCATP